MMLVNREISTAAYHPRVHGRVSTKVQSHAVVLFLGSLNALVICLSTGCFHKPVEPIMSPEVEGCTTEEFIAKHESGYAASPKRRTAISGFLTDPWKTTDAIVLLKELGQPDIKTRRLREDDDIGESWMYVLEFEGDFRDGSYLTLVVVPFDASHRLEAWFLVQDGDIVRNGDIREFESRKDAEKSGLPAQGES